MPKNIHQRRKDDSIPIDGICNKTKYKFWIEYRKDEEWGYIHILDNTSYDIDLEQTC